jgi:lipopolysaccharide/colanic/teichoic acid biosynthesis glycosyltransferase
MNKFLYFFTKRLIDLFASTFALILLSPFLIVISVIQIFIYKNGIMFNQKRVGKNGVVFKVYKFKSMNDKKDEKGNLLPDILRVTKVGKILRALSLDELPQLFNIFNGQMSIVGPRPQSIEVCLFMNQEQFKRHEIKPGLTGLSAINGRNGIKWSKKIDYDLEYIKRKNLLLDIKIIIITFFKVVMQQNVFSEGNLSSISLGQELLLEGKIDNNQYQSIINRLPSLSKQKVFEIKDLVIKNGI